MSGAVWIEDDARAANAFPVTSLLASWRADAGLTLEEIGDLTGVSPAMWSRCERGQREFAPLTRVMIARRLGVRVCDLFGRPEL